MTRVSTQLKMQLADGQPMEARAAEIPWVDANQRHLIAAVASIKWRLETQLNLRLAPENPEPLPPPESYHFPDAALETLSRHLGLSAFERDLLTLCAALELDGTVSNLVGQLTDPQKPQVNFSLALSVLPEAHWSAFSPAAPLRRWKLIELQPGNALTSSGLRIDERILHHIAGVKHLDTRLLGLLEPVPPGAELAPSQREFVTRIVQTWNQSAVTPPVVQLLGTDTDAKSAIASAACGAYARRLHKLSAQILPSSPTELEVLVLLLRREIAIGDLAVLLDCEDLDPSDTARVQAVQHFVARFSAPLLLSAVDRQRLRQRTSLHLEIPKPSTSEQRDLWQRTLSPEAVSEIEPVIAQFNLSSHDIHAIAAETGRDSGQLWKTAKSHARPKLDELASRLELRASWDDLILPEDQKRTLLDITSQVRQRLTVYETWGFKSKGARGLGISALFAGSSGTGKTMAAEVIGRELDLDVYRIDLSSTVSKYIGETEKNLRRIFDAAEDGGAILLFDEADSIFGKRSEVKDSHDRYANLEVSYLLQRMEAYRGLAVLTTNLRSAIDTAFLRRIRFILQFPFPDFAERIEIWRRAFPAQTPTRDLEYHRLAQLQMAGGNIRNMALNAAFSAADAGEAVTMKHVHHAAESEYAKMERQLTDVELQGWTSSGGTP